MIFLLFIKSYWKSILVLIVFLLLGYMTITRGLEIERLKKTHSDYLKNQEILSLEQKVKNKEKQLQQEQKIKEVEQNAITRIKTAQAAADTALLASNRLSEQNRIATSRMSTATKETIINYTIVGSELLESCVSEYREMAKIADGHATDAKRLSDSFPE